MQLTPDEMRMIEQQRAMRSLGTPETIPAPRNTALSLEEWTMIQQRRLAMQSGIATNYTDPFREQCAVAIVVLRELRRELEGDAPLDAQFVFKLIDFKLAILGDDAEESGSPSPGSG